MKIASGTFYLIVFVAGILCIAGCQAAIKTGANQKTEEDSLEVLSSVAGAISGKNVTQDELKALGRQLRKDPEAQSAVKTITDSLNGGNRIIKYCPIEGERYAPNLTVCPVHKVKLELLEE